MQALLRHINEWLWWYIRRSPCIGRAKVYREGASYFGSRPATGVWAHLPRVHRVHCADDDRLLLLVPPRRCR